MIVAVVLGCTGPSTPTPGEAPEHPLDDVLSLAHAQAVGTHNSYHVETSPVAAWAYTHEPLDVQLVDLGVRQLELDLNWVDGQWAVYHVPVIDEGTTCYALADCFGALRAASTTLGAHLPVMVLLEIKHVWDAEGPARLQALDALLEAELGDAHLIRPADVQRGAATLREGMLDGWPVLQGQRGRFVMVVHDGGEWAASTREQGLPTLFTDGFGDLDADWAAVHTLNDPSDPRIAEVVGAGHLVRTRSDENTDQAVANDPTQRDAAFASGATFVSTDFPAPHPDTGYVVRAPGGTPARCNPVRAPSDCTPEALEDPAIVGH